MSPPTLTIRTASPTDIDALLPLIASAYRGDESRKGWTTEADLLTGMRIDSAGLLTKIAAPNDILLLATNSHGALVACIEILKRDDGSGYLSLFAVDPRRQGGGLGRQVLQAAETHAREEMGVQRMELAVIFTRVELIAWYVRRGYVTTGERRPFPYWELVGGGGALRDDLYFEVLEKNLAVEQKEVSI